MQPLIEHRHASLQVCTLFWIIHEGITFFFLSLTLWASPTYILGFLTLSLRSPSLSCDCLGSLCLSSMLGYTAWLLYFSLPVFFRVTVGPRNFPFLIIFYLLRLRYNYIISPLSLLHLHLHLVLFQIQDLFLSLLLLLCVSKYEIQPA